MISVTKLAKLMVAGGWSKYHRAKLRSCCETYGNKTFAYMNVGVDEAKKIKAYLTKNNIKYSENYSSHSVEVRVSYFKSYGWDQ